MYKYANQLKLNAINAYASVDPFTQAPTPSPTAGPEWREDTKCGPNVHLSDSTVPTGTEVPCNGESTTHMCCNREAGYCGATDAFCTCTDDPARCCNWAQPDTCSFRR